MFKLAVRNIFRQKTHTGLTLAAIVAGVVGLILAGGWINDIFVQLGEVLIHSQSGHMQIYRQGYYDLGSQTPEKYLIPTAGDIKSRVASVKGIDNVTARLNFAGLLNNGRTDLPFNGEGVEPGKENKLGSFVSITAGRQLTDEDNFGILIGHGLARALKLSPGDPVTLLVSTLDGALNSMDFQVVGVFQSFSTEYDARTIRIQLNASQQLLGTEGVNAIVIVLKHTDETDRVADLLDRQLQPVGMEVKTWVELNDFYEKTVKLYKNQFGVLQLIILIMVLLSVANSVNMSIFDRAGEFGTMMALGNHSGQIFWLITIENICLGVLGSGIGLALGSALAFIISAIGIPMPPPPNADLGYTAQIRLTPSVLLMACTVGTGATVLAAILPARHIARAPVVEALRQNL